MILSLILCEAIVLFFEFLVPRSPGKLTGRNLLLCTQYIQQIPSFREDYKNSFGRWWGGAVDVF